METFTLIILIGGMLIGAGIAIILMVLFVYLNLRYAKD
jgi:hypothetical protein